MKLVFTFFLFLCFYLPGRCANAVNSTFQVGSTVTQAHDVQERKMEEMSVLPDDRVSSFKLTGGNPEFLCIEEEDSEPVLKKQVPRDVSLFSRLFFSTYLICFSNCPSVFSSLPNSSSFKYITQRVLRI